ncbi:MAG: hypothetical protein Q8K96_08535 [Rubrivivax sp.]|nr:hypothetical protein [Rubrivivax sp.]
MEKVIADPRVQPGVNPVPLDGMPLIFDGLQVIFEARASRRFKLEWTAMANPRRFGRKAARPPERCP